MAHSKRKQFTLAEAKSTGDRLGVSWEKFDVKQFRMGMNAELADGTYDLYTNFGDDDNPITVGKVVRAHLNESPDYYTHWAQMEKEAALQAKNNPPPQGAPMSAMPQEQAGPPNMPQGDAVMPEGQMNDPAAGGLPPMMSAAGMTRNQVNGGQ